MKNLKTNVLLAVLTGMLILFSCKKEPSTDPIVTPTPTPSGNLFGESIVTSSVGGVIVDESGNAVSNAQVTIGSNSMTTDANGVFLFKDIQINAKRTFVKVSKNGFFHGSRALYPSSNSVEYINITLLETSTIGSFTSSSGGSVINSGVTLNFPANSVKVEGGGVYSGIVDVAFKYLDPNNDEMINQMPGDLMAVNSSNQLNMLETYGMVAVELTSPTGQKLNVADGKKVEIKIPLSGAYLTDAPSSIPLWYFDESEGIWKQESSATKIGGEYVGEVSHFSFWNFDFPTTGTPITGSVICGTLPMFDALVRFYNNSGRIVGAGVTNSSGVFTGFIPSGVTLTVKVYAPGSCNNTPIYVASIGSFSSSATLPVINACASTSGTGVLSAKLLDCSGNAITNGVLEVTMGWRKLYFFPNSSGDILTSIVFCSNISIDIQAFDYTNSKQSIVQSVPTGATMNVGNIPVCGAIDEYVLYNLDGTNYRIDKIPANMFYHYSWGTQTNFQAFENGTSNMITAMISGASVGTFAMQADSGSLVNGLIPAASSTSMNATFTTYGTTSGSYKIGTFTGTFTDVSSIAHTLSGSFRLKNP